MQLIKKDYKTSKFLHNIKIFKVQQLTINPHKISWKGSGGEAPKLVKYILCFTPIHITRSRGLPVLLNEEYNNSKKIIVWYAYFTTFTINKPVSKSVSAGTQ